MCSEIYFSASPLYMFRAVHTPIITILTVSTAIGIIHSRSQIVSVTSSQRTLARLRCEEVTEMIWDRLWIVPMAVDTVKIVLLMMGVCAARNM